MRDNYYDFYFRENGHQLFGTDVDWRWLKAIGLAESGLDPEALSPAGAVGVMQIMPDTADWMAERNWTTTDELNFFNVQTDLLVPHINIVLGTLYCRYCWNIFKKETGVERIRFMLGAYNAGHDNIIKAQRRAEECDLATDKWLSIATVLHLVTGRHAQETITYVRRVEEFFETLKKRNGEP